MKITLQRRDDAFHFTAVNETGNEVEIDASPSIGGHGAGARPMEMLIMALGGCSGIDIVDILKKGRMTPRDLRIEIDAEREAGAVPSLFTVIHLHYIVEGDMEPEKVRRAVELSIGKYCSVAKILERSAVITCDFTLNGVRHAVEVDHA